MAPTDLAAKIEERGKRLDQVDQAIAEILRLLRPKLSDNREDNFDYLLRSRI